LVVLLFDLVLTCYDRYVGMLVSTSLADARFVDVRLVIFDFACAVYANVIFNSL